MAVKKTKEPKNLPTPFIARLSKVYPNWDFWFENILSGNPGCNWYIFIPKILIWVCFGGP
jgi:hypothetical protein